MGRTPTRLEAVRRVTADPTVATLIDGAVDRWIRRVAMGASLLVIVSGLVVGHPLPVVAGIVVSLVAYATERRMIVAVASGDVYALVTSAIAQSLGPDFRTLDRDDLVPAGERARHRTEGWTIDRSRVTVHADDGRRLRGVLAEWPGDGHRGTGDPLGGGLRNGNSSRSDGS